MYLYSQPCRLCHGCRRQQGQDYFALGGCTDDVGHMKDLSQKITFKGEERSLGDEYEDLGEYDEEEFEEVDDHDDLAEYDRGNDFWDNIMGTEEDKRTQVWSLSGFIC